MIVTVYLSQTTGKYITYDTLIEEYYKEIANGTIDASETTLSGFLQDVLIENGGDLEIALEFKHQNKYLD